MSTPHERVRIELSRTYKNEDELIDALVNAVVGVSVNYSSIRIVPERTPQYERTCVTSSMLQEIWSKFREDNQVPLHEVLVKWTESDLKWVGPNQIIQAYIEVPTVSLPIIPANML
jgi:hypothetical protein